MTRTPATLLATALLSCLAVVACTKEPAAEAAAPATPVEAAPAQAPAPAADASQASGAHAFQVGTLEAWALNDGTIDVANDGKTFAVGQAPEQVSALLAAAGEPTDVLHLSLQPLLVRAGDKVLLFDTGAADANWAKAGHLPASLRAAGFEPAQVTDIFISHGHQDHVGGLLAGGALAFPNASVHLAAPEWEALQADAGAAALVAAIRPKVVAFAPGAELVPGVVTAVAVDGHTPGHSAYEIASGDARLLYIGDTAHHSVVSLQQPEWTIAYDGDAPLAQASRRALLQRAADGKLRLYAVHFPYPGLGTVEARDGGFAWVAEH